MTRPNCPTYVSPLEAVSHVKSGDTIVIQGSTSIPTVLIDALVQRASELRDVKLISGFGILPEDPGDPGSSAGHPPDQPEKKRDQRAGSCRSQGCRNRRHGQADAAEHAQQRLAPEKKTRKNQQLPKPLPVCFSL